MYINEEMVIADRLLEDIEDGIIDIETAILYVKKHEKLGKFDDRLSEHFWRGIERSKEFFLSKSRRLCIEYLKTYKQKYINQSYGAIFIPEEFVDRRFLYEIISFYCKELYTNKDDDESEFKLLLEDFIEFLEQKRVLSRHKTPPDTFFEPKKST